MQCISNPISDC